MQFIDRFLNNITMYRLVLFGLMFMAVYAIALGFFGILTISGGKLLSSLLILFAVCYPSNAVFAKLWKAPVNTESSAITALILFFVMSPIYAPFDVLYLALAGVIAMLSKYLMAFRGKHLFNPAAFAAVILGFTAYGGAIWWVGTPWMIPVTLIVGLFIVRKIRRFSLFLSCLIANTLGALLLGFQNGMGLWESFTQNLLSGPILFFAAVMVTEPLTSPPRRTHQISYGLFIGAVSSWPINIGQLYFTPELVLLIANIFSFAVSLRRRLFLRFQEKKSLARDTFEFIFRVSPPFVFEPGQYLEWTLPDAKPDSRGVRRFFTIASSPTENVIRLGVKIGPQRSSFKDKLLQLEPDDLLVAGNLAGDFILPKDRSQKLVFIAGGIGITPFRSMIKYLIDREERRDIILLYCNKTSVDVAYTDLLRQAEQEIGLRVIHILSEETNSALSKTKSRFLDENLIHDALPDAAERTFYLSGPNGMVEAYKKLLVSMGISRKLILTDYFPGF